MIRVIYIWLGLALMLVRLLGGSRLVITRTGVLKGPPILPLSDLECAIWLLTVRPQTEAGLTSHVGTPGI